MSTIAPFDSDRIASVLARLGLRWLRAPDGAYVTDFSNERGSGRVVWEATGPDEDVLLVRVSSSETWDLDALPRLLVAVNSWNHDRLFPKAYIHTFSEEAETAAIAEFQVPLGAGIHDELLEVFARVAVATGFGFVNWLTGEMRSFGVAVGECESVPANELEGWLDRPA